MNNLLAILFGIALVILAYLVYVISRFITRLTSTTTIYDNNIKLIIEIYENGSSKYEVIYSKSNSYLSSIIKKNA